MTRQPRRGITPADIWEAWRDTTLELAKDLGRPFLSHGPFALALSGIGLYILGIVRMVGILHAEDVPISRGLPLLSLQDYFLRGLSLIARPQLWFAVAVIVLVLTAMVAMSNLRESLKMSARFDLPLAAPMVFTMALGLGFIPLAEWACLLPGVTISFICLAKLNREGDTRQGSRAASLLTFGVFFGFALSTGARAYFVPPPLDNVVITNTSGEVREAKLLYQSSSSLYVVGRRDPYTKQRTVELLPISNFPRIVIRDGEFEISRTIPELLGLHFYRIWEDDNSGIHFEPSP